jgi:hypothetical protein
LVLGDEIQLKKRNGSVVGSDERHLRKLVRRVKVAKGGEIVKSEDGKRCIKEAWQRREEKM